MAIAHARGQIEHAISGSRAPLVVRGNSGEYIAMGSMNPVVSMHFVEHPRSMIAHSSVALLWSKCLDCPVRTMGSRPIPSREKGLIIKKNADLLKIAEKLPKIENFVKKIKTEVSPRGIEGMR